MNTLIGAAAIALGFLIGYKVAERSQKCHG